MENLKEENDQLKEMNKILQLENDNSNQIVQDLANELSLLKDQKHKIQGKIKIKKKYTLPAKKIKISPSRVKKLSPSRLKRSSPRSKKVRPKSEMREYLDNDTSVE